MKSLSMPQIHSLLETARAHSERDYAAILLAYNHGLRASEVVSLTHKNFRDGYITVQRLKGSRKTVQPLVASSNALFDERTAVTAYLASVPANGRLFPISRVQFWRLVRRFSALAGIPGHLGHPHVLKHSIAMHTIKSAGIENVRQYLGHETMSSTGMYLRVSDSTASAAIVAAMACRT